MTSDVINKLEEAFAWGCSDKEACLWADIAPATLYKYQDKNPDFVERKAELKETPILLSRKSVVEAVKSGDRETAKWLLARRKKDEFSERIDSDITTNGKDVGPQLTPEQIRQLLELEAKKQ